ncbi:MAG: MlaD family protein [Sediminibacterium sp.]|jgi:phospholipid/cholesterol/gamma-HCH transport system substrate-binding protein|uniref:MlaD family protein n=1 Tax=Sediminibacterium sp. TaxID=1917865 RepID=UPI0025D43B3E|nr:MlaD family protein [Sediminibacterium sp.]MDO8995319.1 MlaD family protein [Sediminibacterium sp.]
MTVSNETKVGALTAVAITLLILSFNFLKGKTLLKTGNYLYAKYTDTKGVKISNPVYVNGFQVGAVADIENADPTLKSLIVAIKLTDAYDIPANSVAVINENPLGTPSIEIKLGNSQSFLQQGDTLQTAESKGLLSGVMDKIGPVTQQLEKTIETLDVVLKNINSVFDPQTKNNLQAVIANVNKTTESLVISSASLQQMLNQQTGAVAQSMNNVNKFTKNLSDNNEKVSQTLTNVTKTSENFAKADLAGSVDQLKAAIGNLNKLVEKANSTDGSLGKLINDKTLYNNLNNTIKSANILVDDLRVHPKRYVNISVFGKKDKTGPLMAPLADSVKSNQ